MIDLAHAVYAIHTGQATSNDWQLSPDEQEAVDWVQQLSTEERERIVAVLCGGSWWEWCG